MKEKAFARIVLVAGLALATVSIKSSAQPPPRRACCQITVINVSTRVVTAKDANTGTAFNFKFDSGSLPATLKIGQVVWAGGGKVSLNGVQNCCTIIATTGRGRAPLGLKIPGNYQASYASDSAAHVSECNQVAQTSFPQGGHHCVPRGAMISSGKSPDGSDATYSWTCVCT